MYIKIRLHYMFSRGDALERIRFHLFTVLCTSWQITAWFTRILCMQLWAVNELNSFRDLGHPHNVYFK